MKPASTRCRTILLTLLSASVLACAWTDSGRARKRDEGATLFTNGAIYVEANAPPVEAMIVRAGRVARIGTEQELRASLGPGYRRVDLQGGVAVPGLSDAHGHVEGLGAALESVPLVGTKSYAEVVELVRRAAEGLPAGTWITGRGWDQSLWEDARFPHHRELSRAVPNHPVFLTRVDGHAGLANARALELAGLNDGGAPPEIEGGRVAVDGEGRPTGVLVDTAMKFVRDRIPPADRETRKRHLLRAQEELLTHGLTTVHDMGLDGESASILEELDDAGQLELRIIGYLYANEPLERGLRARYPRPEDRDPARKLRILGAKLMLDGALGSRGAALLDDYSDAPGERGLMRMGSQAYRARLDEVVAAGLQPATHAIGDAANRMVLEAYADALKRHGARFADLRPRVEHAQVVAPEDWDAFEATGALPSMQPTHATSDMRWAEDRLGAARLPGAYAWRRLPDPSRLAFGSDFPVESPSPLLGLYAARTRQDAQGFPGGGWLPEERLSGAESLTAFTVGAAHAAHEEDCRGKLLPGYFADLTVLSVDPVVAPAVELLAARVLLTVVDGVVVHRAPEAPPARR